MPLSPQDMLKIAMQKLAARTGRDLDGWVAFARANGPATHKALTEYLKTQGLNHNEAQWVAWGVTDPGRLESYDRPDELEDALYSGKNAALRPIYDALLALGRSLGEDVRPNVCKTYTSLASGTQFAILAPRTRSAIDVELVLPAGHALPGVEPIQGNNPKFNGRIRVKSVAEVGEAVRAALALAREQVRA